jgi:hypothetical protein
MTAIKERPILFSAPMVRAILDGRKTVTRRPLNAQALKNIGYGVQLGECHELPSEGPLHPNSVGYYNDFCPFGQIGDRLYVRETCFINDYRETAVPEGERADCEIHYRADGVPDFEGEEELIRWRPSIHMPRWASRILLEITDVRVERLQEITYEQAAAEGVHRGPLREWCASDEGGACHKYPMPAFRDLWQSTGGDWDANPWVWVVEFKRVTP